MGRATFGSGVAVLHADGTIGARRMYMPSPKETKIVPEVIVKGLPKIVTFSSGYVDCALASDGTWWNWNSDKPDQRKFNPPGSDQVKISSYFIGDNGVTFGTTPEGAVGGWAPSVGGTVDDIARASGGYMLPLMLIGSLKPQSPVVQVAPAHDVYLRHADGTLDAWGLEHPRIPGLEKMKIRDLAVYKEYQDSDTGVVIDNQGSVWSWGVAAMPEESAVSSKQARASDYFAPLHKISPLKNIVSVAADSRLGIALDSDGAVWEWGDSQRHENADRSNGQERFAPRRIAGLDNVVRIANGMALRKDGSVWVWGIGMAPQKAFDHVRLP